jgi:hypothetical protein
MKYRLINRDDASMLLKSLILVLLFSSPGFIRAQVDSVYKVAKRPVKNTFESIWLIDHQTLEVPIKGTFEMDFQHRFGTWDRGYEISSVFLPLLIFA